MLIDANALPAEAVVEADVCIIGAGPAGITLARELQGTRLRICLLESGSLEADAHAQDLSDGEVCGDWTTPLPETRRRQVGGTANEWAVRIGFRRPAARYLPLSPIDFERRGWMPHSGWPFGFAEVLPFYRRAQTACGAGPFAYDGADWQTGRTPILPLRGGHIGTRVFQFGPRSLFTSRYRDELLTGRQVVLYTHATVLQLQTNAYGTAVTRACVAARNGRRFAVAARTFVLALGGIENARLLLLSNERYGAGLGNAHDLVGRCLMEHPQVGTGILVPFAASTLRRAALYDIGSARGVPVMGHLAPADAASRRERLPNLGLMLYPIPGPREIAAAVCAWRLVRRPDRLFRPSGRTQLACVRRRGRYFGPLALRWLSKQQPFLPQVGWGGWSAGPAGGRGFVAFDTVCLTEQAPHPENRVTLAPTRDPLGQPRARIEWCWTEADRADLRRALGVFAEEFANAGIGYYRPSLEEGSLTLSHHHLGTTRMHDDPRRGVVGSDCRVHGIGNLFVAGSSVFPTGGYANPTLTIVALAIRLADQIKAEHLRGANVASCAAHRQGARSTSSFYPSAEALHGAIQPGGARPLSPASEADGVHRVQ